MSEFEFHRTPEHPDEEIIGPFKVLLVGDSAVGKTCLLRSYVEENFNGSYVSTIGIDFRRKMLQLGEHKYVKLQIWDTAGQERFRGLVKSYFRGCDAVVFVYDITDRNSFNNIVDWIETVREVCQVPGLLLTDTVQCMLVGNKCDLTKGRQISRAEAKLFADTINMDLFETSAKENTQVSHMFSALCEALWMDWETKWGTSHLHRNTENTSSIRLGGREGRSRAHGGGRGVAQPPELSYLSTNMSMLGVEYGLEAKEANSYCCSI